MIFCIPTDIILLFYMQGKKKIDSKIVTKTVICSAFSSMFSLFEHKNAPFVAVAFTCCLWYAVGEIMNVLLLGDLK